VTRYGQHTTYTQREQAPGTVANNGGGFSFQLDKWKQLDRFLILGSEGGTYYVGERKLTRQNATCIEACIQEDPARTVRRIEEISVGGRAHKNAPAVFALSLCASSKNLAARQLALEAMKRVCRTSTDLFSFIGDVQEQRGWGHSFKKAVSRWYLSKTPEALAYQLVKYRQRERWSHRDAIRLSHPKAHNIPMNHLLGWAVDKHNDLSTLPALVRDFTDLQTCSSVKDAVRVIQRNSALTWEMVPTELLAHNAVWRALLPNMPLTAMLRNLGRMTAYGTLTELSDEIATVRSKMLDETYLKKSRVHPMAILNALLVYGKGHGLKGSLSWTPQQEIKTILNEAFYLSFKTVEPINKSVMIALDVSGSMGTTIGQNVMSCRDATAALSLVTARTEPRHIIKMFQKSLSDCPIVAGDTLETAIRKINGIPFGATDCASPITWATANKVPVDLFAIYTDNETNGSSMHPNKALEKYQQAMGRAARMVVVGMTSTGFTISDPNNPNCLDVVGFDTDTPNLISAFGRGEI